MTLSNIDHKITQARVFLAPYWRKLIAASVVVIGLAMFFAAEFGLGHMISNNEYVMAVIAIFGLTLLLIAVAFPFWGYAIWFFLSCYLKLFGQSIPARYNFDLIMLGLLAIVLIFRAMAKKERFGKLSTMEIFLIAYFVYAYIVRREFDTTAAVLQIKTLVLTPLFFYYITKSIITEKKHVYWLMIVIVVTGVSFALMGIYEQVVGKMWLAGVMGGDRGLYGGMRSTGPAGHYYVYGNTLTLTILLCLHLLKWQKRWFSALILWICTGVTVVGLYYNFSRGPYAGFCISLIIMMILARHTKKIYSSFALLLVLTLIVVVPIVAKSHKIQDRFKEGAYKGSGRTATDQTSRNMLKAHFFFGVGKDKYRSSVPIYVSSNKHTHIKDNPRGLVTLWGKPHSEYYLILAELGIVGFFVYFAIYVLAIHKMVRIRSILPKNDVIGSDLAAVAIAYTIGVLLTMYSDEFSLDPYMYAIMFTVYAMLVKLQVLASKQETEDSNTSFVTIK